MLTEPKPFRAKKKPKVLADPVAQAEREKRRLSIEQMKARRKKKTAALYKSLGITGSPEEKQRKLAEYCERTKPKD